MKPLKDYILVGEKAKEEKTESGLILSGIDLETGAKPAEVVAIGPDVKNVNVGDTIAIKWGEALAITVKGAQRALVSEEYVYGIYDK